MEVCVTYHCEKFKECQRSAINNPGLAEVHSYGTEGRGGATQYGIQSETFCGPAGDYKMFIPMEKTDKETSGE